MAAWQLTINLADLNQRWKSGEIDISELADLVTTRIKNTEWRLLTLDTVRFDWAVAAVQKAATQAEYIAAFEALYDLADADLVWINTTS